MNHIYATVWPHRDPEFGRVAVSMLAIAPEGNTHQSLPLDATDELREIADRYWAE